MANDGANNRRRRRDLYESAGQRPRSQHHTEVGLKNSVNTPSGVALADAKELIHEWFHTNDDEAIEVVLGAAKANTTKGPPVWLLVVAPPSTGKTTLVEPLGRLPGFYGVSSLTSRTIASGLDSPLGEKVSLLSRLPNPCTLVVKDMSPIQAMRPDQRADLLASLRDIYDGSYRKLFGNGKDVTWKGKLGFIGAATNDVDRDQSLQAALGERFLHLRLHRADDSAVALQAMSMLGREAEVCDQLAEAFGRVLDAAPAPATVTLDDAARVELAGIAIGLARWRAPVARDHQRRIAYSPEPEGPGRLVKQFQELACGIAAIRGRSAVGEREVDIIRRVAIDSMPALRSRLLAVLSQGGTWMTAASISAKAKLPESTLREKLEDLELLALVRKARGKRIHAWRLTEDLSAALVAAPHSIAQAKTHKG